MTVDQIEIGDRGYVLTVVDGRTPGEYDFVPRAVRIASLPFPAMEESPSVRVQLLDGDGNVGATLCYTIHGLYREYADLPAEYRS